MDLKPADLDKLNNILKSYNKDLFNVLYFAKGNPQPPPFKGMLNCPNQSVIKEIVADAKKTGASHVAAMISAKKGGPQPHPNTSTCRISSNQEDEAARLVKAVTPILKAYSKG